MSSCTGKDDVCQSNREMDAEGCWTGQTLLSHAIRAPPEHRRNCVFHCFGSSTLYKANARSFGHCPVRVQPIAAVHKARLGPSVGTDARGMHALGVGQMMMTKPIGKDNGDQEEVHANLKSSTLMPYEARLVRRAEMVINRRFPSKTTR